MPIYNSSYEYKHRDDEVPHKLYQTDDNGTFLIVQACNTNEVSDTKRQDTVNHLNDIITKSSQSRDITDFHIKFVNHDPKNIAESHALKEALSGILAKHIKLLRKPKPEVLNLVVNDFQLDAHVLVADAPKIFTNLKTITLSCVKLVPVDCSKANAAMLLLEKFPNLESIHFIEAQFSPREYTELHQKLEIFCKDEKCNLNRISFTGKDAPSDGILDKINHTVEAHAKNRSHGKNNFGVNLKHAYKKNDDKSPSIITQPEPRIIRSDNSRCGSRG